MVALASDVVRKILRNLGLAADLPPAGPAQRHDVPLFDEDFQTGTPARLPP